MPRVVVYYLQDSILHNTVYWPTQVFVVKKDVKRLRVYVFVCACVWITQSNIMFNVL